LINSISRAIKVIQCLGEGLNGVVEIAERLSLSKATVHRILQTLESTGMVIQEPFSRKYYIGPTFYKMSSALRIAHQGLVALAFDEMWYLRDLTGESVALQIQSGLQRALIEELESRQNYRYSLGRDYNAPLFTGSGGIAMLSQLTPMELEALIGHMDIFKTGPGAVKDKKQLNEEIEKAKQQGYAVSVESIHIGTAGISVPICNYSYPVALSVFGPKDRLDNMISHIPSIKERGDKISNRIKDTFVK
jgi:DNA-binding IclR family transcriptional regulator